MLENGCTRLIYLQTCDMLRLSIHTDFAFQIVEKWKTIAFLNTEIVFITANIDILKVDLKKLLASGMGADEILEKLK